VRRARPSQLAVVRPDQAMRAVKHVYQLRGHAVAAAIRIIRKPPSSSILVYMTFLGSRNAKIS